MIIKENAFESTLIEITQDLSDGYHPLAEYDKWLVAILNGGDKNNNIDTIEYMEYHSATDEVFVLLEGKASLLVAPFDEKPKNIQIVKMDRFKCYNIKRKVWHGIVMSDDAKVLIVENSDTARDNSGYYYLDKSEKEYFNSLGSDKKKGG